MHFAVKVHRFPNCVGGEPNLSEHQVSTWKRQFLENAATLFESTDKQSDASIERIAQLEQLVGKLTLALEIEKSLGETPKQKHFAELNPSQQRCLVETLRTDYSVRQICETLGFNKSTLYYQLKIDPSEEVLCTEIEQLLAALYPKYW